MLKTSVVAKKSRTKSPPVERIRWRDFFGVRTSAARWLVPWVFISVLFANLRAQDVTIAGQVTDAHSGTSLPGMLITFKTPDGIVLDTLSADGAGAWSHTVQNPAIAWQSRSFPSTIALGQNYPNPFNPSTRIPFQLNKHAVVRLSVFNLLGQKMDGMEYALSPGAYAVEWQGRGSAGVLFYSMEVDGARYVRKMVQLEGSGGGGLGRLITYSGNIPSLPDKMTTHSCWVVVSGFAYEPDSASILLEGSPRADLALTSIHDRAFVVDLHNDVLERIVGSQYLYDIGVRHTVAAAHTDLPRMEDGGLDAQLLSVWVSSSNDPSQYYGLAVRYLDSLSSQVVRNSSAIAIAVNADSIEAINSTGRIAGVLLLEGGHSIADDLEKLKYFYSRGVRCMTITWNNSTSWAVSAQDSRSATVGLSDFGKQVIRTMDSLGMIIDVSHVGKKTVEDILGIAKGPVIASHSGCAALYNHYRNLTDDQIRAVAATGGVIGVVFYPPFLGSGTATIETVANHIDHIRDLLGNVDNIALGSDFDGIERTPVGLEDVTRFPELTKTLLRRGYSRDHVRKILGGNFLRVLRSVCK